MGNWNLKEVVVIDLEATCWDTEAEKSANISEIIEIGVCILDALTGEIKNPRGIIIKPQASEVSPFCTQLTSITPEMVSQGMSLFDAINILQNDYGVSRKVMAAYGNYDQSMLIKDCANKGVRPRFGPTYLNVSAMATLKLKAGKRLGLSRACGRFGLTFEGQAHRGVDDAVMAAKVLWEIIK